VLFSQLLVKVPHVKIKILLSVQAQDFLHRLQRNASWAGFSPAAVVKTVIAVHLITSVPAPHLAVANADDLRRLPPSDLLGHSPEDDFLDFQGPLHGSLAVIPHVHP